MARKETSQEFPDDLFQSEWTQAPFDQIDTPPTIAQVEFVGKTFKRTPVKKHPKQDRQVRIIGSLNEATGQIDFKPIKGTPSSVTPSDLPHFLLNQAIKKYDLAEEGKPSLTTVRKHGSSTPSVNTEELIRERSGNPGYRSQEHPSNHPQNPSKNS